MRDLLPAFARHLASLNRSPRTTKTYEAILSSFLDSAAQRPPSQGDVESFLARPRTTGGRRSAATRNQELAALRAFAKFAIRGLHWTTDPTEDIPFVREPPRDPAVLSASEVRRLFTAAAETKRPAKRAQSLAVLALLSQLGLRVHEAVGLDVAQLDLGSATLVGVKGKGGTVHDLPMNVPTVALIMGWLAERAKLAGAEEAALFVSSRGSRLSIRTVQHLMLELRTAMGSVKKITPHTLRHSAATLALTTGSDLSTVAELLRHSDLNTTRRYLHLVDERPSRSRGPAPGAAAEQRPRPERSS